MMGAPKILSACAVPYQGLKHAGSSVHKCQRLILGCCHPTPGAIWSSFTVFDTRQISLCRPLINATKSAIKTAKIWPEEATLHLQDCFDQTHWDLFSQQATHYTEVDREENTATVLFYISICMDNITVNKKIRYCQARNHGCTEVQNLLKACNKAFKLGDTTAYRCHQVQTWRKAYKKKKRPDASKDNMKTNSVDTRSMEKDIRAITDYQSNPVCLHSGVTPSNSCFAHIEISNNVTRARIRASEDELGLTLSTHDV